MPNILIDLEVDRVDLVDEGANSEAHIKLYKRKETGDIMELKDIVAKMKPEHAAVVTAEIEKAKSEVPEQVAEELAKAKAKEAELTDELAKAKEASTIEKGKPSTEDVIKGLDPAVQEVFKSMQREKEAAEEIAKAAAEKTLHDNAIAKAKQLGSLPVEESKLVEVVKGISPEVFEILKAANDAIENSDMLDELGTGVAKSKDAVVSTDDAWDAIEKAAGKIAEEKKISVEKAIGEAIKENPDLYRTYLNGGKA